MCRRVTCKTCKQPTWAGCGAHVEQVLGDVPKAQRCQCRTAGAAKRPAGAAKRPAAAGASASPAKESWFRRTFGGG